MMRNMFAMRCRECPPSAPWETARGFHAGRDFWIIVAAKERRWYVKSGPEKQPAEDAIRDIRRATRRHFSAEEKIRVVLEGLRGEESIAELCRREGIASSMYYGWSKEFLEYWQEAARRRHGARRDLRRGEGSPPRSTSVEGGRGRSHPRKPTAQKKHDRGWGRRGMRYSPSDKTEIIGLVEQSTLPARRTLEKLGIPRSSFYRWYDRYQRGGPEALADRPSRPDRVWNRIPEAIRSQIVDLALDQPELSPREVAVRFTDEQAILCLRGVGLSASEST